MKLKAKEQIRVFIDKRIYKNQIKNTDIGKIPEDRRENLSSIGCYYTIQPNEIFYFNRSNNWDLSYFNLENGAEFKIETGDYMAFIKRNNIEILNK